MATTATPQSPRAHLTAATVSADRNWAANRAALLPLQPALVNLLDDEGQPAEWVFGRDGYLTAIDADGRWAAGCSLPLRAARSMLTSLEPSGVVGCFLLPPLASHLRVALDKGGSHQAVIGVVPDLTLVRMMLGADDFSREISSHRLWFAAGEAWPDALRAMFEQQPGLPTPSQFIRLPHVSADVMEPVIASAQRTIAAVNAARAAEVPRIRAEWKKPGRSTRRVLVLAASQFRLWDDASVALAEALPEGQAGSTIWSHLCVDDPAAASPMAVVRAAIDCDGVVSANVARADAPDLLPSELPWVCWITNGRIPTFTSAGPNDALALADAAWLPRATQAGWPADRIQLAGWPTPRTDDVPSDPAPRTLDLIADTRKIEPPAAVEEFSSHLMLWNTLLAEIEGRPEVVGTDPAGYLSERIRRFNVSEEGLNRGQFIDRLIVPALVQTTARLLSKAGLPLRIHGSGWNEAGDFTANWEGIVGSRSRLARIARQSGGLIHPWPIPHVHPIEALGRPVVRTAGSTPDRIVWNARLTLAGKAALPTPAAALSTETLLRFF